MRLRASLIAIVVLCLLGVSAQAAAHTQARLLLAAETARPGDTVVAGVQLKMESAWHTYWQNPGASGMPTQIKWTLPPGVSAGEVRWPVPEKLPEEELTTYIYKDEVVLLVPLKLAPDLRPGPLTLKAEVSWLECNTMCLPGSATAQATLVAGTETKPSKDAPLLASWEQRVPKSGAAVSPHAWWGAPAQGDSRPLVLEWNSASAASAADFYPYSSEQFEVQPATERLASDAGKIRIQKQVKKLAGDWPGEIAGVLIQRSGKEPLAYEVKLPVGSSAPAGLAAAVGATAVPGVGAAAPALWQMLLYAFIGGLILNIMPCVLPVIALKILGFVNQAKDEPRRVRKLGLIYGLGVMVSFLALAGLVIGVKAAGHKAGWGMQFSNPQFVVGLTVLVTLVALNLFGLFEINLGGRVMTTAGSLSAKHGSSGAFFNGVLATVLATPCTAPFLGAALGFAFAQKAAVTVLMFLVVGLGLALPYVLLSWEPAWLKFLPKPGAWMQRFKVAMGFPMLATAIWLFSLLPLFYGERAWWLAVFLLIVALAAWVYGEFVQRGRSRRGLALAVCLGLLVAGYAYVVEGQLQWRSVVAAKGEEGMPKADGIAWQRWSPQAVAEARAAGRPVLVDFTAAWCLTCQANKKFALEVPQVRARLQSANVLALLGDYTRFPEDITAELNRFGRAGVPLVLVYPKRPDAAPIVLPEALTPGIVMSALERATQ